jgi:hypothetical protein
VVADAGERRQRLAGDRVEQVGRVADARGDLAADLEVELGLLLTGDLAVHLLDLRLEFLLVDQGARVGLGQGGVSCAHRPKLAGTGKCSVVSARSTWTSASSAR